MKRVMFVDDEIAVLDGLRNRLRRQRGKWEMFFILGGKEAVSQLSVLQPDAVVTDMRMPGIDGAGVLQVVRENHPQAVRVILSGHSDHERMLRALSVAHQFLAKPCDAEILVATLERVWALQDRIHSDPVWRAIGAMQALPPLPRLFQQLTVKLTDPAVNFCEIASLIGQDVAMTVRILRYVNSPFFGLQRTLTDLRDAIGLLGLDATRTLVLSLEWFELMQSAKTLPGYSHDKLQIHSLRTARLAAALAGSDAERSLALSVGMVHDIGSLAMACFLPQLMRDSGAAAEAKGLALFEAEEECLGFSHAEIGGYLLSYWGLPFPIVEAVVNHHRPSRSAEPGLHLAGLLHIAEQLQNETSLDGRKAHWDQEYVQRVLSPEKLEQWRGIAAEHAVEEIATGSPA